MSINVIPLQNLKGIFNQEQVSRLARALPYNDLVWEALISQEFVNLLELKLGTQPENWTPGNIAMIKLEQEHPEYAAILENYNTSISPALTLLPLEKLDLFLQADEVVQNLADAALAAGGMIIRSAENRSWDWILENYSFPISRNLTSILYPLVDFSPDIIGKTAGSDQQLILYSILASPLTETSLADVIHSVLAGKSLRFWASILSELQPISSSVCAILSQKLIEEFDLSHEEFLRIRDLISAAKIAGFAGMHQKSIDLLEEARKLQEDLEAELLLGISKGKMALGDEDQAAELLEIALQKNTSYKNTKNIIRAVKSMGKSLPVQEFIPDEASEITMDELLMHLEYSRLNNQSIAVGKMLTSIFRHQDFQKLDTSTKREIANSLVKADRVEEANTVLRALLSDNPNDILLLTSSRSAQSKSRDLTSAIQTAEFIEALEPARMENKRTLASFYCDAREYQQAYDLISSFIDDLQEPLPSDKIILAKSALGINKPNMAMNICQDLLETGTSEPEVHRLMGDAQMALNKPDEAFRLYKDAFNLDKTDKKSILAISKYYRDKGMVSVAKEFIQNAVAETGLEPLDISLELYDLLQTKGEYAECRAKLEQMYDRLERGMSTWWLPVRTPVYQKLAKAFLAQDDTDKAVDLLKRAHEISSDVSTAIELTAVLNEKGDFRKASEIITPVIIEDSTNKPAVFEYANAALGLSEDLRKASRMLETLQEQEEYPDLKVSLLLGKTAFGLEEYNKAESLADELLSQETEAEIEVEAKRLKARLLANDGDLEEAIQMVKQASLTTSLDPTPLNQDLVEFFYEAGLEKDALREAKAVFTANQEHTRIINWYADMMELLNSPEEKLTALKHAADLHPESIDTWIELGKTYATLGKTKDANQAFETAAELPAATPEHLTTAGATMAGFSCYKHALPFLANAYQKSKQSNPQLIELLTRTYIENRLEDKAVNLLEKEIDQAPEQLNNWLLLADQYIRLQNQPEALRTLDRAKTHHSENHLVELKKAHTYRSSGNFQAAQQSISDALEINPLSKLAKFSGAKFAYSARDYLLAEKFLDDINLSSSDSLLSEDLAIQDVLILKSQVKRDADEKAEAKALITSMQFSGIENDPLSSALLAQLHSWEGEPEEASRWLQKSVTQIETVKNSGDMVAYAESLIELARAYTEVKDFAKALSAVKQAAKTLPNEISGYQEIARVLLEQANYYHLLEKAQVINNKPHSSVVSEKTYSVFSKSLNNASRYNTAGSNKVRLDQMRTAAKAAFNQRLDERDWDNLSEFGPVSSTALINHFEQHGDWVNAVEVADKSPETPAALFAEAKSLEKSAPEMAAAKVNAAIVSSGEDPLVRVIAAKYLLEAGNIGPALENITSALQQIDNEPNWHALAGDCFAAIGNLQPALFHYSNANELMPGNPEFLLRMAELYLQDNSPSSAIESLEKAIKLNKKSPRLWMALAQAQMKAKDFKKAVRSAEKAQELQPDDKSTTLQFAEICLEAGQTQKALKASNQLKAMDTTPDEFLMIELRAHMLNNSYKQALATAELGISAAQDNLPFKLQKAILSKSMLSKEDYLAQMKDLAVQHPEDPKIQNSYSQALFENNKVDEAIFAAQKALQLSKDKLSSSEIAAIHSSLGKMLRQTGQQDQAIQHLSKAIEIEPKSIENYQSIAKAFIEGKEYEKAISILEDAISNDPNNADHYVEMARVYKERKDYPNAEKMLKKAAEINPNDLHIQRQLAGVLALNIIHSK